MNKKRKQFTEKMLSVFFVLAVTLSCLGQASVAKAYSYTGTYLKSWYNEQADFMQPTYGVTINKISKGKIRFQVSYSGINGSPLYQTHVMTAKYKNGKAKFRWEDTWENTGKGILKVYKGYVKVKMVVTKSAETNRGSLSTNGFLKLKKKNNKKKVDDW